MDVGVVDLRKESFVGGVNGNEGIYNFQFYLLVFIGYNFD